ncbi:MAG: response regulator [Kofleriaceae bacterium]
MESSPRVLVAEDDRWMRALIGIRLRRSGYEVFPAGTGTQVLALLEQHLPHAMDVLVMDVHLPGCSGLDVAERLRSHCAIPIVLVTAFPDAEIRSVANRLGIPLLTKPFSLDRLSEVVDRARVCQALHWSDL